MATDTVQQIKDRLSIVDVVSQYVKLERAGASTRARCPFHAERTPSFHVSPDRGTYHCFGCGVGGDIFSFVEAIEGLDFKGALKVLAEKAGVELSYEKPEQRDARDRLFELLETATIFYSSRLNDAAKKYLKERGISEGMVQSFRVGWAGDSWSEASEYFKNKKFTDNEIIEAGLAKKSERGGLTDKFRNRIMFPIGDPAGRIVGFSGRIFGEHASPEAPKYLNSPETPLFHKSRILYGFDKAKQSIRKHNFAILVEGQMDLLASHEAGWGNTVAVSGTAFTPEHVTLVKRMTENLVIALDADQAGIKAAGKAARVALSGGMNVKVAQLPDGMDPADLINSSAQGGSASGGKEGVEAWRAAIRDSKDIITFLLDVLYAHAPERDKFRRNVEAVVLPFLADVQSPIAREQYVREIARRLNVSEGAVMEAFSNVPRVKTPEQQMPVHEERNFVTDKIRQAYALLIWQESMPVAAINTQQFEKDLRDAVGDAVFDQLRNSPTSDQEALRFLATDMFKNVTALDKEALQMSSSLLKSRLQAEVAVFTDEMRDAEMRKDAAAVDKAFESLNKLRERLAQI